MIAGHGEMIGLVGIRVLEDAVLDRIIPTERMRKSMAGNLHVRQREHLAGDILHLRR